ARQRGGRQPRRGADAVEPLHPERRAPRVPGPRARARRGAPRQARAPRAAAARAEPAALLRTLAIATLAVLPLLAAPAAAPSKRYPPEPVDKDAEKSAKSNLCNAAVPPERHPYQDLVRAASDALTQRTGDATLEAIKKLDAAIKLLPSEPEAYRLRGDAYLERKDWARCSADFAAADASIRREAENPRAMAELHRKLALCQARAGTLADAAT